MTIRETQADLTVVYPRCSTFVHVSRGDSLVNRYMFGGGSSTGFGLTHYECIDDFTLGQP